MERAEKVLRQSTLLKVNLRVEERGRFGFPINLPVESQECQWVGPLRWSCLDSFGPISLGNSFSKIDKFLRKETSKGFTSAHNAKLRRYLQLESLPLTQLVRVSQSQHSNGLHFRLLLRGSHRYNRPQWPQNPTEPTESHRAAGLGDNRMQRRFP